MNIKTIALATILATGVPVAVQAQEAGDLQNYQVSCETGAECSNFNVNFEQEGDRVAQIRRTRTRRTRSRSVDSKYYAGGNIGLFFPGEDGFDTGFGGAAKFGYNFTKNVAAEIEGLGYFGGSEIDDLGYNVLGLAANGVFKYPFNPDNDKSVYGFAGAGIGIGRVAATGDVVDQLEADAEAAGEEFDSSETGFLFQGKAGIGYPIGDKTDIFGQARYLNVSVDDLDNSDGFAIEAGASYNF